MANFIVGYRGIQTQGKSTLRDTPAGSLHIYQGAQCRSNQQECQRYCKAESADNAEQQDEAQCRDKPINFLGRSTQLKYGNGMVLAHKRHEHNKLTLLLRIARQ